MNNFLKTLILSVLASNYLFAATMCPSEISFNQGKLYYKNGKEITDWRQDYFNVPINNEKSTWEKLYPTSINAREQRGSGASIHWSMHCEYATE